jgi:hypothetical protein
MSSTAFLPTGGIRLPFFSETETSEHRRFIDRYHERVSASTLPQQPNAKLAESICPCSYLGLNQLADRLLNEALPVVSSEIP